MGLSVSASRGAGDRAGTIARMCLALMFLVTAARNRLLARALIRFFGAISLAVAIVFIVKSGADDFVFRILAALLRRLARALTLGGGVRAIAFFSAVAVLLDIEPGAEDMAAALLSLVARASIRVVLAIIIAVAIVRLGIESGADYFVYRKGASGPEGAGGAGERGEREGGQSGDLHDAENTREDRKVTGKRRTKRGRASLFLGARGPTARKRNGETA